MGQQKLIYSLVARGTFVLADYTEFKGNFNTIASQCLQKLSASNNRFTYTCDDHTFNYLVDNGFNSFGDDKNSKSIFKKGSPIESLPKLKEQMQYCVDHPKEISQIAKVQAQVSEVKGVMMQNIEKVLDRGEKIELLVDKTDNLKSQAQDFRKQGTKMKRNMWIENMKIKLVVFGIVALLALLVALSVCPKFKC
ncbi:hypothetical protein SASPL_116535 [Salvia splendens]|uniref:Vesicle-associated membrane protein 72 n=1 Tax=Salvia splendens TaxID=180675 RepID=A0A8X8XTE1_SALSN|nr:hypothetical protein SASPL_116535 [Salvia splendens]